MYGHFVQTGFVWGAGFLKRAYVRSCWHYGNLKIINLGMNEVETLQLQVLVRAIETELKDLCIWITPGAWNICFWIWMYPENPENKHNLIIPISPIQNSMRYGPHMMLFVSAFKVTPPLHYKSCTLLARFARQHASIVLSFCEDMLPAAHHETYILGSR